MNAEKRREKILEILIHEKNVISASKLAEMLSVSRQIIVGDIALLRAVNNKILSTSRGYILESKIVDNKYVGKVVSMHFPKKTREELYIIVDMGGKILDVAIEHEIYGELTGKLELASRIEVDEFMNKVNKSNVKLLTELTNGVHIHSIATKNKEDFLKIKKELEKKGFLYNEK